jgi:hypothetical protein
MKRSLGPSLYQSGMDQQAFYRKLFMIRYARLLQKAEQTYKLSPAVMDRLREEILSLDWIDRGVDTINVPRQ